MSLIIDRPHGISASEQAPSPDDDLATAEDRVARARVLSDRLFKETKRMPQYKIVQASKDRVPEFRAALLGKARWINSNSGSVQ